MVNAKSLKYNDIIEQLKLVVNLLEKEFVSV